MTALVIKWWFSAWQEVTDQEEGMGPRLEAPQRAVYYKETTPGPHMDSEYRWSSYLFWV